MALLSAQSFLAECFGANIFLKMLCHFEAWCYLRRASQPLDLFEETVFSDVAFGSEARNIITKARQRLLLRIKMEMNG